MHPFRFAVQVSELPFDSWRERVRWYEDLGFTTISVPDHYTMWSWDPLTLMAAAAGVTRTAAVGSTVLNAAMRQPIDLARMAATLAEIAAGGCELGLGGGWTIDDFKIVGMPYDRGGVRLNRLEEYVQAITLLWSGQTTTYRGDYIRLDDAPSVLPPTPTRRPKLLLGGTLPRALDLAGRHADIVSVFPSLQSGKIGWPGWAEGSTIAHTAQQTAVARAGAERAGRDPADLEFSTQISFTAVADDPGPLQEFVASSTGVPPSAQDDSTVFLTGTPAQARDRLQRRRDETGLSYFVVFDPVNNYAVEGSPTLPGDSGPGAADRYLEAFADAVVRPLSGQ
ncbi:MAG: LLM class flavin-dependent oxidoreductase [Mycobacteriaceae bacterium]